MNQFTLYSICYDNYGQTRITEPQPTLGLAIKAFFELKPSRPNLSWVDASYANESARKWLFPAASSEARNGSFFLKVIKVGSQTWLLCNDPEENASVMASVGDAIAASEGDDELDVHTYALQLMKLEPANFEEGL